MPEFRLNGLILAKEATLAPGDHEPRPCRLCAKGTRGRGYYTTFAPLAIIAPNGRDHFRIYALCPPCAEQAHANPSLLDQIEREDERLLATARRDCG